jgi:hypothetical protein
MSANDQQAQKPAVSFNFEAEAKKALRAGEVPAALRAYKPVQVEAANVDRLGKLHDIVDPSAVNRKVPTLVKPLDYYRVSRLGWKEYSSFIVDCAGTSVVMKHHFQQPLSRPC